MHASTEESSKEPEYIFDTEYLKKMLKFHKQVNDMENILGVYISSNNIDAQGMVIVKYFLELFTEKSFFRSPLKSPIIMLFDPTLKSNKLDIKILNIYSFYYKECPLFSEMPFKFKLDNLQ